MERTRQDLVLGIVFFASLGILMWATIELTGLSFSIHTETRHVLFGNVSGLRVGDNVFVLGHRAGSVSYIGFNREAHTRAEKLEVRLLLDEPLELTDAYSVAIEQGNLLGGVQVQIDPGDGPRQVLPDQPLRGSTRMSGLDAVGELFSDEQIGADLRGILSGIRLAVDRLNAGESTLGRLFTDGTLYDEAVGAVKSARRSLEAIEEGRGGLGRLIHDPEVGEDLAQVASNTASITAKLDGDESLLARLIGDDEMGADGQQIVSDVAAVSADLRAGRGALGTLLTDGEVADDVRTITSGFADLAEKVNDPEAGLIGDLVGGGATRERFATFVTDLSDMAAEVRDARGLLGRVIYDEELGEQFSRMLTQVSRAIQDARESAPVGTFFQVISGAF